MAKAVIKPVVKHENSGRCLKCIEIMDRYPNMNTKLRSWFTLFQAKHKEAHISCAGRGHADQEAAKLAKTSKASYGQSAHNYNCAIDLFVIDHKNYPGDIYPKKWFENILAPEIPFFLRWYGEPGCSFYELPHLEIRDWRGLLVQGAIQLVEPHPEKESA